MLIELLIPGLLGPALATKTFTPSLERLFADARLQHRPELGASAPAGIAKLMHVLGLDAHCADSWPTAPYSLSVDDPTWDRGGFWLHADPVHLRADRDHLRLFDSGTLAIQPQEARQLVAELNAHFRADGMYFSAPVPERWYLRVPGPVDLLTQPLRAVMGASLAQAMPGGADARRWNAMMTEAQMLMHQSPVNQVRASAGRASINGLWLSGPGTYAPFELAADVRLVISDDPLVLGLARAGEAPTASLNDSALAERLTVPDGRVLLIELGLSDALARGDLRGWEKALEQLDRRISPILAWALDGPGSAQAGKRVSLRLHDDSARAVWVLSCERAGRLGRLGRLGLWLSSLVRRRRASGLAAARAAFHRR